MLVTVLDETLIQTIACMRADLATLISAAGAKIQDGPDNPAITRVPKASTKAFRISSRVLFESDNWSAFYHDWKAQYQLVSDMLEAQNFAAVRDLLKGKSVQTQAEGRVKLAPEVIEHVKSVVGSDSQLGADKRFTCRGSAAPEAVKGKGTRRLPF